VHYDAVTLGRSMATIVQAGFFYVRLSGREALIQQGRIPWTGEILPWAEDWYFSAAEFI